MYTLRFATVFFLIAALWSSTFGRAVYDLESQPNSQRRDANDDKKLYVEYFANGTVKTETREELLEEFRKFANLTGIFEMFTDEQLGDKIDRERRTIFGEDERIECPVSNFPYCAVGKLDSGCTAILVGPYHALTAAHCVYDISTNTWKDNLNLRRGRTCRTYGTTMYWTNVWILNGYALFGDSDYDFALVIYNPNNPSPCYAGFGYKEPWSGVGVEIYGYPSDKRASQLSSCYYDSMYCTSCPYTLASSNGLSVQYDCDVYGLGNHGAGLYSGQSSLSPGYRGVYGVHTASGVSYNSGVLFNRFRFCKIVEWMEGSGYYPTCGGSSCC